MNFKNQYFKENNINECTLKNDLKLIKDLIKKYIDQKIQYWEKLSKALN